jgi:hypothetical protein
MHFMCTQKTNKCKKLKQKQKKQYLADEGVEVYYFKYFIAPAYYYDTRNGICNLS